MILTIRCPHCQTTARVEDQILGRKIRCKDCETVFVAKASEEAEPPPSKKSTFVPPKPNARAEESRRKSNRYEDEEDDAPARSRPRPAARDDDRDDDDDFVERPRRRRKKSSGNGLYIGLGVGAGVLVLVIVLVLALGGKSGDAKTNDGVKDVVKGNPPNPGIPLDGKGNGFFGAEGGRPAGIPFDGKGNAALLPDAIGGPNGGLREGEPNIPEADRKLYTMWNVRLKTVGTEIVLSYDFRRKNQTDRPGLMYVLMTDGGQQLVVDLTKGNASPDLFEKSGTVIEKFVKGNGNRPFGPPPGPPGMDFGKSKMGFPPVPFGPNGVMPKFNKGSKFWIAGTAPPPKGSGPFAGPSVGVTLSNVAEIVVD
jgi:predicted Zn finger-like uncharacterized protein